MARRYSKCEMETVLRYRTYDNHQLFSQYEYVFLKRSRAAMKEIVYFKSGACCFKTHSPCHAADSASSYNFLTLQRFYSTRGILSRNDFRDTK